MYKCIDCIIIYSLSGTQALKGASAYSINEFLGRGDASSLKVPWSPFLLSPAWLLSEAPHQPHAYSLQQDLEGWGETRPPPPHGPATHRGRSTVFVPGTGPPCQGAFLGASWRWEAFAQSTSRPRCLLHSPGLGEAARSGEKAGVDLGHWSLQTGHQTPAKRWTAWGDAVLSPLLAAKCTSRAWAGCNPKTTVKHTGKIPPELLTVLYKLWQ